MMSDAEYSVSTGNSFVPLCEDGDFQTVKRKRNNTGYSEDQQIGAFMDSSIDQKLNMIHEDLRIVRFNQEQMSRGMVNFERSIRGINDKLCEVIDVTNKNSDVLKTLAYKSIDLEARSRRNNLIFWGHVEMSDENCFFAVREFIKRHLDLDADKMYIARAHRLGPRKIGHMAPRRPIIANFRDYCDTDIIMSRAYMLKNTPFSIGYDLPKEIKDARKRLWDEVKRIRQTSPRVKFQIVYPAKLLIEGRVVRDEFPDWGKVMKGSRLTDFEHINRNFLFDQDLRTSGEVRTRDQTPSTHVNFGMNEHSGMTYGNLNMPSSGPHDVSSGTMEHDQSDSHEREQPLPQSQEQNIVLPPSPAVSSSSKQSGAAAASKEIFRPYDSEIERPSRPTQRGYRRQNSVSVSRDSRQSSGNTNINKQSGSKCSHDLTHKRNQSVPPLQTVNTPGASGENEQGASGENGNADDFNTKF